MEVLNLMAGGAVFGVVASSWEKVKAGVWRCFNLFIQDITADDEETKLALPPGTRRAGVVTRGHGVSSWPARPT